MTKYLIIGAGIAGATAAETIREHDSDGEITLISGEPELVYNRVLLPNYLKGRTPREKLFVKTPESLAAKNITVKAGTWVKAVGTANHIVTLDSGEILSYDKLLIAAGGRPKKWNVPGADKTGVFHFQTIADTDAMLAYLPPVKTAAIVGAGFISLEFIDAFHYRQIETHLIMRGPYFWSKLMDEEQSQRLMSKIESLGVVIHPSQIVTQVMGEDKASGVKTEQGLEVRADLVGYGIGLDRYIEFLESADIKVNKGVAVNEYLESSVSGVYAAGDIAEYYDPTIAKTHIAGNWDNAQKQGKIAGLNMAGGKTEFHEVTFYSMTVGGLFLATLGNTTVSEADDIVVKKDETEYVKILLAKGRVIGAIFVGGARHMMPLKKLILDKAPLSDL